ncbi:exopolyphosphatase [Desulfovibrio sp. OttesenSCG-928-I05]|nr:exopolyphosphatase [Desulfovibrio sp. OttesenSCG-928-I05]
MRLVTRSDFDGLVCGALLKIIGVVDDFKFVHPKDLQDGIVEVSSNDILANVPYVDGCGMWFDHHTSENERLGEMRFEGLHRELPSCARVIWEYYGGHARFSSDLDTLLEAVDKVDSGMLSIDDIKNPSGWVLLGFIMDPRTGLGRYRDYRISNYQLMMDLIDHCATKSVDEILALPDVKQRTDRYFAQEELFRGMLEKRATQHRNVLVIDLREQEEIYSGNRFTAYALYPDCNISIQVMWGFRKQNIVFTVGYSILNRSSKVDVGSLMLKYGGGGHTRVGTCQIPVEKADQVLGELIAALGDDTVK